MESIFEEADAAIKSACGDGQEEALQQDASCRAKQNAEIEPRLPYVRLVGAEIADTLANSITDQEAQHACVYCHHFRPEDDHRANRVITACRINERPIESERMAGPSERTVKRLFALSRNRCAYPDCQTPIVHASGTITGEVCHIKAQSAGGPRFDHAQTDEARHAFENLMLLCSVHHRLVDDQPDTYTVELLTDMKEMHERNGDIELSAESARMAQRLFEHSQLSIRATDNAQVMVGSPGGIQAQQVVIKTSKRRSPTILPTQGAIGHNLSKRTYTLHLIERYNDFQKWDSSKQGVGKYIVLGRAIKKQFGAKWDLVPETRFFQLIDFIQTRILNSKLGRIKNARGEKCFSSWEEWHQEHFGSVPMDSP